MMTMNKPVPSADDISRIEALERNLFSLERFVHDLQKDILDLKKRVDETGKSRHE